MTSKRRIYGLSFKREAELLGAGSDEITKNTPFTPDEQKEIAGRLQEIAKRVGRTYSLSL